MSGYCAVVAAENQSLDRDTVEELIGTLRSRGPDDESLWLGDRAALACTTLRTRSDGTDAPGPFTRDGRWWIAADARIDGQAALRSELRAHGRHVPIAAADAELILHAYDVWGERCLEHLIGDFSFAIWDARRRSLFAARDAFGVRPLFYAITSGGGLVLSNHLPCIRRHPGVSREFNELAIADFLLFENNKEQDSTFFRDIRRLPAGHAMRYDVEGLKVWPHWTIPEPEVIDRTSARCIEEFDDLLNSAVADRLRTSRVGIHMSGGIDSASVATYVASNMREQLHKVQAYTAVYDWLIPHDERAFAEAVAQRLGLSVRHVPFDDYLLYERAGLKPALPEPWHEPDLAAYRDWHAASGESRVVLTGWDGDALLNESPKPWLRSLLKQGHLLRALSATLGYASRERRLPHGLRLPWKKGRTPLRPAEFPAWLNADFSRRLQLEERFLAFPAEEPADGSVRPATMRSLRYFQGISNFFDQFDPAWTGQPVEYRHPLFDVRVVKFCLTLAPWPWCIRKHALRETMVARLPEQVRTRPKTPLPEPYWPFVQRLARTGMPAAEFGERSRAELEKYVDLEKLRPSSDHPGAIWEYLRPVSLGHWLNEVVQ